ncbi:hypothetical protein E4U54_006031, partial [Claviceps lovelessii]
FTTRGIVALVFSCITGILGMCVVAWYGMSQPVDEVPKAAATMVREAECSDSETRPHHDEGSVVEAGPNKGYHVDMQV